MSTSAVRYLPHSRFLAAYFVTMRPYLLFVSGSAGAVGLSFLQNAHWTSILPAFIVMFLSYGFGQALTDCFQTDTDAISSPYRPLVRGLITRRQVVATSLFGLAVSAVVLAELNPVLLLLGAIAVVGLIAYTPFKRRWWGGPLWNSWIVALLPMIGWLSDPHNRLVDLFQMSIPISLPFWAGISTVFFAYANFVVMGYFKDISADRKTGYQTLPVVFGWRTTAICSDILAAAAALSVGVAVAARTHAQVVPMAILGIGLLLSIVAQIGIHRVREEARTHKPISHVVRVFLLYCMAVVASNESSWIPLGILYYQLFELALHLRPEKSQV